MTTLTDRVRTTLQQRADGLAIDDVPFDPDAPGIGWDDDAAPDRPAPPGRRLVPVAAALLVVGLAAALVVARSDDDGERTTTDQVGAPTSTTVDDVTAVTPVPSGDGPGHLATAVPDDLEMTSLTWGPAHNRYAPRYQLFSRLSGRGGRVLIVLDVDTGSTGGGTPLEVRGAPAAAMPSKELPDSSTTITWNEGAAVQARVIGMELDEAVTLLDGLTWRDEADHLAGFAAPAAVGVDLIDEVTGGNVEYRQTAATYADDPRSVGPGVGRQLTVRVGAGAGAVPTIEARFAGVVDAEGRATSYDPRYGTLVVTWPDGLHVWIDAGSTAVSRAELEAVAASIEEVSGDELAAQRAAVDARLAEDAPLLTVDLPVAPDLPPNVGQGPAIVTVHGEERRTVCIALDGDEPRCDPASEQIGVASLVIDGTWYVVLASTDGSRLTQGAPSPGADPVPVAGTRSADVDGWHVALAAVPDGVDEVFVGTDLQYGNVLRPGT